MCDDYIMWEKFDTNNDKFYDEILSKAKIKLPEIVKSDQRFVIPDVESNVEGNRTFFRNFKDLVTTINRSGSHVLKFFYKRNWYLGKC